MDKKIKITAVSVNQFTELENEFNQLHPKVRANIMSAHMNHSTTNFTLLQQYSSPAEINVPDNILNVHMSNNGVKVYCKCASFVYPHESREGYKIITWS